MVAMWPTQTAHECRQEAEAHRSWQAHPHSKGMVVFRFPSRPEIWPEAGGEQEVAPTHTYCQGCCGQTQWWQVRLAPSHKEGSGEHSQEEGVVGEQAGSCQHLHPGGVPGNS